MVTTSSRPDPRPAVTLPVGRDKHAHYSYRDFFRFNRDQGTIIDWNNTQNLLLSEDFIVGLQTGLEREVGDASAAVMYTIGRDWGIRDAKHFSEWYERENWRKSSRTSCGGGSGLSAWFARLGDPGSTGNSFSVPAATPAV